MRSGWIIKNQQEGVHGLSSVEGVEEYQLEFDYFRQGDICFIKQRQKSKRGLQIIKIN